MNGVAKSYFWSDDELVLTISLNQQKKWNNGDDITANDFIRAFYYIYEYMDKSPITIYLSPIKNWTQICDGLLTMNDLGVYKTDDNTIVFEFEYRVPYVMELLGNIALSPVHESHKGIESGFPEITNGSFYCSERQQDQYIKFCKNPYYPCSVMVNDMLWVIEDDIDNVFEQYKQGKIHATCNTQCYFYNLERMMSFSDFCMIESFNININLYINSKDINEKMSIYKHINRNNICKTLYKGVMPNYSIVGDNTFIPSNEYFQIIKSENTYPIHRHKIQYSNFYPNFEIASLVAQEMNIKYLEEVTYPILVENCLNNSYDGLLHLTMEPIDTMQASMYRGLYLVGEVYEDAYYQGLVQIFENHNVEENRYLLNHILLNSMPYIPLGKLKSAQMINPRLKNYKIYADGYANFRSLRVL